MVTIAGQPTYKFKVPSCFWILFMGGRYNDTRKGEGGREEDEKRGNLKTG